MTNEKHLQYAVQLGNKIAEIFDKDCESDFHISLEELQQDDNATAFFHALANVMPAHLFNKITGEKKSMLEFNYIANALCFQFCEREK